MKNIRKTFKKGFTLIELIIVMAIFSILLAFVMTLTGPVSRIFKNTSLAEKTYSYANNIQVYLQGKLEYTDNLYVYTGDQLEQFAYNWYNSQGLPVSDPTNGTVDDDELYAVAESFRAGPGPKEGHYKDVVSNITGKDEDTDYVKGNIYILRLVNTNDGVIQPGQITERTYHFVSNEAIPTGVVAEVPQLNEAYFNASDSAYSFSYALGASTLVNVPNPSGADAADSYKALDNDFNNSGFDGTTLSNLSVSIIIDKDPARDGYIDVDGGGYTYRAFKNPVVLQVANLPLTNINMRAKLGTTYGVKRPILSAGDAMPKTQVPEQAGKGFKVSASGNIDFDQDIYFVYAYADELQIK